MRVRLLKRIVLVLALLLLVVACRREEPSPTPTSAPQAEVPEATETAEADEPAEPTEPAGPEATPEAGDDLGLLPAIDPAEIDWPPQVIYSSPLPGDEVMLDGAITIRFDQPMDQESVEAAFEIRAAEAVTETEAVDAGPVSGEFQWPQPDTLIFTPESRLERQQTYRVRINEEAAAQNGETLQQPVDLTFETIGDLEVAQVSPADDTNNVSPAGVITIIFNRPVVPLVVTGQQADLPDPVVIEPAVEGEGEWTATSIYRFVPDEGFAGGTEYTVTVPAGLEDVTGNTLPEDFSFTFSTAQPSVTEIRPGTGETAIAPSTTMTVTFNTPMDPASTEAAISLDPAAPLSFEWSEDGRTVVITPQALLEFNTRYTLTVADTARSVSGEGTLDRTTAGIFTTVPLPRVVSTSPSDDSVAEPFQYGFNIEFAGPMDPETIEDRIQIDPEPRRVNYFINNRGQYVYLDFQQELNQDYTVTIPGDVADPYGNTLGEDVVVNYTTAGFSPLVSLNLPGQVTQLTTNGPTDVTVIYRNVGRVEAALYDVGLPLNLVTEPWRVQEYRPDVVPLRTWSLDVAAEEGVAETLTLQLGEGEALPPGVYLLEVGSPDIDRNQAYWQIQRALLFVNDTNIVVKEMPDEVHVWATDLATGAPVADLDLVLYSNMGAQLDTAVSDENGFASFVYNPPESYLPGVTVISNESGEAGFGVGSSTWQQGVSPWEFNINATTGRELPEQAYIYTDRPIYRPGDTVYFKGVLREADYGRYDLPGGSDETVTVAIEYFSFFEPSESLGFEEEFTLDEFGTFYGEYTLPEEIDLGEFRLFLVDQFEVENAAVTFQVADYRAPEFQVTVTPAQEEALRGDTVEVTVEARYFFGAPAGDLPVTYSVYAQSFTPEFEGEFYSFSNDENFYYYFQPQLTGFYGEFVTSGSGQTDAQGRMTITLPADLLAEVEEGSRRVTVEAQVSDLSEFPVSARGQVVLHAADLYVGIRPEESLSIVGNDAGVELATVDWNGEPVANQEVEVVFYERTYEYIREQRFGVYDSFFEPVDTEVARTTVTTDGDGRAVATFTPEFGGTFRAVATVADAAGRTHSSNTFFWVADQNFVGWRTDPRERRMDLVPDLPEYEVGDTANILVQSPFEGPVNAWVVIERGNMIEQRLVTLETNSDRVQVPITPELAPNAYVSVIAVKGVDESNPYADIRLGIVELRVSPERLLLNIELAPRDDQLAPGETVTYDIRATDYAGNGVQTSLSLALVDLAVLSLVPDNQQPIADVFYRLQPFRSQTGSGLFISGEGLEVEVPQESGGFGGGGGNGAVADSVALDEEDDARRDFPDTAFWEAALVTGADGTATVDIPLPDSTTTWRLSAKGVTEETLVGQASVDIVATLPLLVRPVTPRFFTVGDVVQVGAIINNNTNESLEVTANLEVEGLTLEGEARQTVTVGANSQELVRWPVTVQDVTAVGMTFRAQGGEYRDATRPTFGFGPDQLIPVYRYDAEDLVGTSGVLDEAGRQVEGVFLPENIDPRRGELEIRLEPSLAAAIFEAIEVVEVLDLDTTCAHGVVNSMMPNVAAALAFQEADIDPATVDPNLDEYVVTSIRRLAALQIPNNGMWGYCTSSEPNEYLTAYILFGLAKAEEAGYDTSPVDVDRALRQLNIIPPSRISARFPANQQAFLLYVLANWDRAEVEELDALFAEHQDLLDPYAKAYLAMAYELAGAGDAEAVEALLADLNASAIVSATGAHWEDLAFDWRNLNTRIRGTAVVIAALAMLDAENPLGPQAVRWLMSSREAVVWPTPFETVWSLLALTDWVAASGELEAEYAYSVGVNGTVLQSGEFDESNLLEATELSIALDRLPEEATSFVDVSRGEGPGRLYYTTHLDAYLLAETVQPVSRGVQVERVYYDAACDPETETCEPITQIAAGQAVRVQLTIIAPNDLTFVVVEDPLPAGAEAQDPGLLTTAAAAPAGVQREEATPYGYWGWWSFEDIQFRDEKVVFRSSYLAAGTYQYTYTLEPAIPGEYQVMPAIAYQEFFPEVFGRSNGMLFVITE